MVSTSPTFSPGVATSFTYRISNPNTYRVTIDVHGGTGAGTTNQHPVIQQWCGGQLPGIGAQPCCPPDASTQGQIQYLINLVTLLQRQLAPFAYLLSTVHTGLTGDRQSRD